MSSSIPSANPPITINVSFEGTRLPGSGSDYPYRAIFTISAPFRDESALSQFNREVFNEFIGKVFSERNEFALVVAGAMEKTYALHFIVKSLDGYRALLAKVSETLCDIQIDNRRAILLGASPGSAHRASQCIARSGAPLKVTKRP